MAIGGYRDDDRTPSGKAAGPGTVQDGGDTVRVDSHRAEEGTYQRAGCNFRQAVSEIVMNGCQLRVGRQGGEKEIGVHWR